MRNLKTHTRATAPSQPMTRPQPLAVAPASKPVVHALWYVELALEVAALVLCCWRGHLPWFCGWLAVDLLFAAVNIWIDHREPARLYQYAWMVERPLVLASRIMAAREAWQKFGGRLWLAGCFGLAGLIHVARAHAWPQSILEAEFALVAIASAGLGLALWLALDSARKVHWDPKKFSSPDLLKRIDDYRFKNRCKSRAAAIIELLEKSLR